MLSEAKTLAQGEGQKIMERETGVEPATCTLARCRSTTEPLPHLRFFLIYEKRTAFAEIRYHNNDNLSIVFDDEFT